ncbi:MAG: Crp/Fnr family transcriptional regulator [bacterium]|nr:Crp/Fnr family transcriptional regulator [bacterium]
MCQHRLKVLQNMPIFGGIREDVLDCILENSTLLVVPSGQHFFHENEQGNSMFVLEQGRVAVTKSWKGHEYLLTEFQVGDCFGEMSLIDLGSRTASVIALEDCSAIELSNSAILRVYRKDLEQFTMIQMNMGREVSRRLRKMDEFLFQAKVKASQSPKKNGD